MKNFLTLLLIFSLISGTTTSCGDECNSALADLTTSLAVSAISAIAGAPFDLGGTIKNAVPVVSTCLAENTANASASNYMVQYGMISANYTSLEQDQDYPVQEIPAGMQVEQTFNTMFNEPGFYNLITTCDVNKDVEELDDDNNSFEHEEGFYATSSASIVIEVLPNPNYTRREGEPFVEMELVSSKLVPITE